MDEQEKQAIELFQPRRKDSQENETWVKHYLYVNRASDADRLGRLLASDGFKTTVRRSGDGRKWLILVIHRFSVGESSIAAYRSLLESMVAQSNCPGDRRIPGTAPQPLAER
jgi:hypothetical protein